MRARLASVAVAIACGAGLLSSSAPAASVEPGPILSSRDEIAILGDSFSAGEGAGEYLSGHDTAANPCHRSVHTYLVADFDIDPGRILACSGAVANDVHFSQQARTVAPQVEQLRDLRERSGVDAVVVTLGGNDAGFADVATSCLLRRCWKEIYTGPPWVFGQSAETFVAERLDALPGSLRTAYRALNYVVNGDDARAVGGPVPILVLAYPLSTPKQHRECKPMRNLIRGRELPFLDELGRRLNNTIEEAVSEAREEDGIPIFFVRDTEEAFRPNHTLCDESSYARTLPPLPRGWREIRRLLLKGGPGVRELLHPNRAGYAAISHAVMRWSRSEEATEAVDVVAGAPVAERPPPTAAVALGPDLGRLSPGTRPALEPGVVYPLSLDGFAPGSRVEIGVRSDLRALGYANADGAGSVAAGAAIPPDLSSGDHTVVVSGQAATGTARVVEIPFRVDEDGLARRWVLLIGLGGGLLVAFVVCRALGRRARRLT